MIWKLLDLSLIRTKEFSFVLQSITFIPLDLKALSNKKFNSYICINLRLTSYNFEITNTCNIVRSLKIHLSFKKALKLFLTEKWTLCSEEQLSGLYLIHKVLKLG